VTQTLADMLVNFTSDPAVFMLIVMAALLFLGMLMDAVPIMICLAPLLGPVAKQYGIDEIQFGNIFVITCMIGLVTPPVGIVLFMTTGISGVKLEPLSKAVLPFVVWMIICVVLMVYFPWLTVWFPKLLGF
jgi:TRAP-type C4-dicarboxylate transport system permease large subunit